MIRMVDEGNPNCDHQYPRGGEWCAICGRYRHADQVKELVAKAPPLSQDQISRISLIFSSTAKDIDGPRSPPRASWPTSSSGTACCATPSNARAARTSVGPRIGAATSLRLSTRPWRRLASSASAEPPGDE